MGQKLGGKLCPFAGGELGSQLTQCCHWPGPRPTYMPSVTLIHPTAWP